MKAARKRAGLSQQELADRLGVKRLAIIRLEGGQREPSMTLALAIARELGENLETLFGGGDA